LRLIHPGQIREMSQSLERLGQLHPVITRRTASGYQVIDGFKRYYASEQLGWESLNAKVLDIPEATGKAMILNYNKGSHSLADYEEGLIVHSLKHEHHLSQKEISELTGYSESWVCRRLSLIERLEDSVQSQLRLGAISTAHAREIIKLPRGNQGEVTQSIISNHLTSRESTWLTAKFLASGSKQEQEYLLANPKEAIAKATNETEIYDSRLGKQGNRILKSIEMLYSQQHIFIGQYSDAKADQLSVPEMILLGPNLKRIYDKSGTIQLLISRKAASHER
jgi:ParB family transcriptional regulator, chromosome partitioning protein